jgi:N-acyl-L-homoserine lactone synthetase
MKVCRSTAGPAPGLSWRLQPPPGGVNQGGARLPPDWLEDVRSLRGSVLFDNGRRPHFGTENGGASDPDPLDLHAYHVLAYEGATLVGCVRIYHVVPDGPPCVTEKLIGQKAFLKLLSQLGIERTDVIEIGRWVVHPAYRPSGLQAVSPAVHLAAGAGAVALGLSNGASFRKGAVVCAAGTEDRQDVMLARIGLSAVPSLGSIRCDAFGDKVRVMYCTGAQHLSLRFLRLLNEMATSLGLTQASAEELPAGARQYHLLPNQANGGPRFP